MATIDKRSKKSWRARVRVNGFPEKTRSFDTHAEAKAWADRVEMALSAGVDTVPDLASELTLSEALDKYEAEEHRRKRDTSKSLGASRRGRSVSLRS